MRNFRLLSRASLVLFTFASAAVAGVVAFTPKSAHADGVCAENLSNRTPTQVIEQHVALLAAGNIEQAVCDYTEDAVVILPGQVFTGITEVRAGLEFFAQLFGGAPPVIQTLTAHDNVVLLTFDVIGPQLSIINGGDTYIIKNGKIRYQTVHDEIVPTPQP
jgi:hypothetical protein